jgi:molybdopterin molybdotransferase
MIPPSKAEELILGSMPTWHREDCPLPLAHGRVLRADIVADRDLPPYDRVTMDGFALRSSALAEGVRTFRVQGVQAAGMRPFSLGPEADSCIEIMTGAVLPTGADLVVPYEEVHRDGERISLRTDRSFPPGHSVHARGGDHRAGSVVVPAGTRLTGREIAVAAACGRSTLTVTRLPKIAVVATGDELVDIDAAVGPHQVRRSNDYALRAALIQAGYPHVGRFHLRDIREEIEHLLWHIVAEFDVVILTGGVSKGKFDYLPGELDRQGVRKLFHGVSQRPGKPFWFGISSRQTPVFALPGNPVATYVCLHRYVLPALRRAGGEPTAPRRLASLVRPAVFAPKLTCFLPVVLECGPGPGLLAAPAPGNTSGDFAGLIGTDGFVELPPEPDEFPAGTVAPFWPWA